MFHFISFNIKIKEKKEKKRKIKYFIPNKVIKILLRRKELVVCYKKQQQQKKKQYYGKELRVHYVRSCFVRWGIIWERNINKHICMYVYMYMFFFSNYVNTLCLCVLLKHHCTLVFLFFFLANITNTKYKFYIVNL